MNFNSLENINRSLIVIFTVVTALTIGHKLDSFLSFIGSIACIPIGFILPSLFHYRIFSFFFTK